MDLQKRYSRLERQLGRMPVTVSRHMGEASNRLHRFRDKAIDLSRQFMKKERYGLQQHLQLMATLPSQRLSEESRKLEFMEQTARLNDPKKLLERGYSLTYVNGRLVKNVDVVKWGDEIVTRLYNGELSGPVEKIKRNNPEK